MIDVMHPSARKSVLVSGPMLYSPLVFSLEECVAFAQRSAGKPALFQTPCDEGFIIASSLGKKM